MRSYQPLLSIGLIYPVWVRAERVIQDFINAKNFKEFALEFKSQDLRQLNKIKKDRLRVCEIRTYFELRDSDQCSVTQ